MHWQAYDIEQTQWREEFVISERNLEMMQKEEERDLSIKGKKTERTL